MPPPDQYRTDLDIVVAQAQDDLAVLWAQAESAEQAREMLFDELPGLAAFYGSAAGTLAADWYDDLRAEVGAAGAFTAIVAELPDAGRTNALAGWATTPAQDGTSTLATMLTKAQGGLQLVVAGQGRDTVTASSIADPQARGWQRSARGAGGCAFCSMLAARGAVYSRSSVDFGAHDHCKCVAVPVFDGSPFTVKPYTPSDRRITDADRERVARWIATHLS